MDAWRLRACEVLLQGKANVEDVDHDGNTPLMRAMGYGNEEVVRLLLAEKAFMGPRNHLGEDALIRGIEGGRLGGKPNNTAVIKSLIHHGLTLRGELSTIMDTIAKDLAELATDKALDKPHAGPLQAPGSPSNPAAQPSTAASHEAAEGVAAGGGVAPYAGEAWSRPVYSSSEEPDERSSSSPPPLQHQQHQHQHGDSSVAEGLAPQRDKHFGTSLGGEVPQGGREGEEEERQHKDKEVENMTTMIIRQAFRP